MASDESGLSAVEAARRLVAYGPNEPVPIRRLSAVVQLFRLFANPLVIILLVASAIAGSLGQRVDALIIVTMVVLGVTINFWQSYRSQQAADRLRASVNPTATVLRDGAWVEIPLRTVVPGDVFRLSAGDLVPADARLIESRDLSVQQSMLTGESLPADKMVSGAGHDGPTGADAPQQVFLGTSVVSGTGTALATATGPKTMFGDIAVRLRTRAPETEFEHGLRRFSLLILRTTIVLVLFILLMGIAFKHDAFESLLFAVALGVGLTPEFLPMISSVTLTQGALRMARDQVIVKHLPAIQNFGSIDVLCSDKTGTLTAGIMQFERAVDPLGAASPRPLTLAYINGRFETGIRSPLDAAILHQAAADVTGYQKIDEIPFDFERRRLSVVVETPEGGGRRLLITKGAPEPIVGLSTAFEAQGQLATFDATTRRACTTVHERLSADGLRVLAVAYRWLEPRDAYSRDDEANLVLAGFVSFADPVLPDVADVLAELKRDGVTVKILTGDNELVAHHVCRHIALDDQQIASGDDIARIDDAALGHLAEQASVFTRVSPALTGLPFVRGRNYFALMASQDSAVELSGQLKTVATAVMKIANDLRWMNSGPQTGLAEIVLPSLQPGSSIMPGKVNPVIPEAVTMVCAQVMGNDLTIMLGGQAGNFQLNVMLPVIAYNLLQSVTLLARAASVLASKAIAEFAVNAAHTADLVDRNPIMVTVLNPVIGYETGAKIAERACAERRTVKEVAAEMTNLTPEELDRRLNPRAMTEGGFLK